MGRLHPQQECDEQVHRNQTEGRGDRHQQGAVATPQVAPQHSFASALRGTLFLVKDRRNRHNLIRKPARF